MITEEYEIKDYVATRSNDKVINSGLIKIITDMKEKGWTHYDTVMIKHNYKLFFRRKKKEIVL